MTAAVPWPTIDDLAQLGTAVALTAPPEAEDANGHVNVVWFYQAHMAATDAAFTHMGLDDSYLERTGHSVFSVEHHIQYHAEVLVGHDLSFHLRLLGRNATMLHGMTVLANHTTGQIANTVEFIDAHVSLTTRRTHPIGDDLANRFDRILAEHHALPWDLPRSREIRIRSRKG